MKLLNELITSLSDAQPSLIDALVKTKVLLHQVGRKDLTEWVNSEINGYSDDALLPEYRILDAQVKGNVTNNAYSYNDHPLPTMHLDKAVRDRFEKLEMRDSIAVLEGLSKNERQGLQRPLPIETGALFNKALTGGYRVQQAWCDIGVGRMSQIIAQVRSKLLDFLLELQAKVGEGMSEDDVKRIAQSPETGSMFNHAIFGDNVTILVGSQSQQSVHNQLTKGDLSALSEHLQRHHVPLEDIALLKQAIAEDAPSLDVQNKRFGPRVKDWLSSMLGKAVETSWQIELNVAAGLLTSALQTFYGW
jgi:hypothetical protein